MSENEQSRQPETQEFSIEDYQNFRTEKLLKYGFPASELFGSSCFTIEEFHAKELDKTDELPESLSLGNYKNVLFYYDFKDTCLVQGFNDEESFDEACKQFAGHFREESKEWQEGVSNLEYYKHIKDQTLLEHGFPESELVQTNCIIAIFESHLEEGKTGDPVLTYASKDGRPLGWEPFNNEAEFKEACKKFVEYAEEVKQARLTNINEIIDDLSEKVDRVWTHEPEEQPGEYDFNGKIFVTSGLAESLKEDEIKLLLNYIWKRVMEHDGADYLQTFTANDGERVWAKDQLDRKMKASGDFKPEYNYATLYMPRED